MLYVAITIIIIVLIEVLLRRYARFLVDPCFWFKQDLSYLPKAKPKETFSHSLINHPWLPKVSLQNIEIKRNNLGYRGEDINLGWKEKNEVRIFLVGDSFLADHYNSEPFCLNNRLQENLSSSFPHLKIVVNTTAYSGETHTDSLATIIHQVYHLQPDIIIASTEVMAYIRRSSLIVEKKDGAAAISGVTFILMGLCSIYIVRLISFLNRLRVGTFNYFKADGSRHTQWDFSYRLYGTISRPIQDNPLPQYEKSRLTSYLDILKALTSTLNCQLLVINRATRWTNEEISEEEENTFFWTWYEPRSNYFRYRQKVLAQAEANFASLVHREATIRGIGHLSLVDAIPKDKKYWVDDLHPQDGTTFVVNELATALKKIIQQIK